MYFVISKKIVILDHFTVVLKCKQKCQEKVSSLNGDIHKDLLPSHYNYLQFAYFKGGYEGSNKYFIVWMVK